MSTVEMTSKNPMKEKEGSEPRSSLSMTFNINEIKQDMLKQNGGKLTEKMEKQLKVLENMDESGDGEISLMELIHMEEKKESAEKNAKKNETNYLRNCVTYIVHAWMYDGHGSCCRGSYERIASQRWSFRSQTNNNKQY